MTMHDERDDDIRDELLNDTRAAITEKDDDEHFYGAWKRGGSVSGKAMAKARASQRRKARKRAERAERKGLFVDRSDEDRRVAAAQKEEDRARDASKSDKDDWDEMVKAGHVAGPYPGPGAGRMARDEAAKVTTKKSPKAAKQDKPAFSRWVGKRSAWSKGKPKKSDGTGWTKWLDRG